MRSTKEAISYLLTQDSLNKKKKIGAFIGNEFLISVVGHNLIPSENPATGQHWLTLIESSVRDVDRSVAEAQAAFESWSATSKEYRSKLLNRVADIVEDNLEDLARLESRDQGKTVNMARDIEIPRCVHNFRIFASAILHHTDPSIQQQTPVKAINFVKSDPVGVAALIVPWNLPLYLLSFKLAPALACGNTVVCKPSEMTSATAWVLMHAFVEAGFPPGVVNMVLGTGPNVGEPLVRHPDISLISFTGSTVVGRRIGLIAAEGLKKVSLEMGGKNAAIVFPSADLTEVMPTIVKSCFANQGEICLCTSRMYVHREILEQFLEEFLQEMRKLKVGDPTEASSTLGAMISRTHYEKVVSYIKLAENEGLKVLRSENVQIEEKCEGYFIPPTVILGASDESRLIKEEIFGPVVCIIGFEETDEVIARANSTKYGLCASVWSKNVDELTKCSSKLRVGTVWCNCWLVRELNMPFGGTKESGIGREGTADSFHFFTEQKTICLKANDM